MRESEYVAGLLVGILVLGLLLVTGLTRPDELSAFTSRAPLVGRTLAEVQAGPPSQLRSIRASTPEEIQLRALLKRLGPLEAKVPTGVWGGFRSSIAGVVIHPLAASVPDSRSEEGPPWHMVVAEDGALEVGRRLQRGRPAAPPGLPANIARRYLHVAVPFAEKLSQARKDKLSDAVRWIRRKMEADVPVHLVSDLPGSTAKLPAQVDVSALRSCLTTPVR